VRPTRVAELLLHHLWQALRAGSEVALWALQRAPPIRPGVLPFQPRLRRGPRAELFAALSCLAPGTLPIETEADGSLLYHCLDVHRPVGQSLASDEARLARVTRADGTVDGAMTR
jgi:multicomponent Na+:H+ antiporter subunit E